MYVESVNESLFCDKRRKLQTIAGAENHLQNFRLQKESWFASFVKDVMNLTVSDRAVAWVKLAKFRRECICFAAQDIAARELVKSPVLFQNGGSATKNHWYRAVFDLTRIPRKPSGKSSTVTNQSQKQLYPVFILTLIHSKT